MSEKKAKALAKILGGTVWNSGGDTLLVIARRNDGKVVAISDEAVAEYRNEESLESGHPDKSIDLI